MQIEIMSPQQVAQAFGVDAKTVARWAKAGKLDAFQTPGGHRRFYAAQVNALITGQPMPTVAELRGAK